MNVLMNLETVSSSAQRLFPNLSLEAVLAHLLMEHAQKNLIRYQSMIHQFETKYGQSFDRFRQQILTSIPDFTTEQDYFDWEMAITAADDMKAEIVRLKTINFVLIYHGQRLYARDALAGQWHRHPVEDPTQHDYTAEGQRIVELDEFLNEIEVVLAKMNLP